MSIMHDDCHDPYGDFSCTTAYCLAQKIAKEKWDNGQNVGALGSMSADEYLTTYSDARIKMRFHVWKRCKLEKDLVAKEAWILKHGANEPPNENLFVRAVDCGAGTPEMALWKDW